MPDAASTTIGSGEGTEGKITVTVVKAGAGGNLYTIAVSTLEATQIVI